MIRDLESLLMAPFFTDSYCHQQEIPFNSNLFCCSVKQVLNEDETIFIPSVLFDFINHKHATGNENNIHNYSDIVLSLSKNNSIVKKKTGKAFLQELSTVRYANIIERVSCKNTVYYITKGLILDEDLNPLVVWGFECKKSAAFYNLQRRKILISPKVLLKQSDTLFKYLLKEAFPLLLNGTFYWDFRGFGSLWITPENLYYRQTMGRERSYLSKIDAEITSDIDNIVAKPVVTIPENEVIKELLKQHKEEIVNYGWA